MTSKLNTIKWLGILTMTIDHIGAFIFPEYIILRIIGRIALPCFLYGIHEGTKRTRNYPRYVCQLLVLAIVSATITTNPVNVIFSFILFSVSIKYRKLFLISLCLSPFVEYGIYGFLLGWSIVWLKERNAIQGVMMGILASMLHANPFQFVALLTFPIFKLNWSIPVPRGPKWFFYVYYPLHVLLLKWIAVGL